MTDEVPVSGPHPLLDSLVAPPAWTKPGFAGAKVWIVTVLAGLRHVFCHVLGLRHLLCHRCRKRLVHVAWHRVV